MAKIKTPLPKVKSKKMHWSDKLFTGLAGLSTLIKHPNLRRSIQGTTPSGQRAAAAMLRKYGKWGVRGMSLANPYTAVPYALTYGAKHLVGNALEGYKNQDVEDTGSGPLWLFDNRGISEEGSARLLRERLAREDLYKRVTKAREEGVGFWERARMRSNPDDFYESTPNIERASQLSDKDFHGRGEEGKWFNFNEGGLAGLL